MHFIVIKNSDVLKNKTNTVGKLDARCYNKFMRDYVKDYIEKSISTKERILNSAEVSSRGSPSRAAL